MKIILIIIILLMQILTYLIIRGGTMNKSNTEIKFEKLEQEEYIKKWEERRKIRKEKIRRFFQKLWKRNK